MWFDEPRSLIWVERRFHTVFGMDPPEKQKHIYKRYKLFPRLAAIVKRKAPGDDKLSPNLRQMKSKWLLFAVKRIRPCLLPDNYTCHTQWCVKFREKI
jgi:hypothetical protein